MEDSIVGALAIISTVFVARIWYKVGYVKGWQAALDERSRQAESGVTVRIIRVCGDQQIIPVCTHDRNN